MRGPIAASIARRHRAMPIFPARPWNTPRHRDLQGVVRLAAAQQARRI